ncbi:MAG: hypothetical protein ACE5GQ_09035, partial [Nitrospinales bacterium]
MKQLNVKSWVQERVVFLALGIFVCGAAAYIGAGKILSPDSIWLHPLKEFSLIISMIGVVSFGYEIFLRELTFTEYKKALEEIVNPDAVRLGIKGLYKNRSELGKAYSFESLFKDVKREVFIGGSSLLSIATNTRELLKDKVLSGITVKLLLMNPNSKVVDLIISQGNGKPTFRNEIKTSLLLFQKLQDELESEAPPGGTGKLLVHVYDIIPSHSFISIDVDDPRGIIVADIGPYLGRSLSRPSMLVVNKRNGMYAHWRQLNNALWEGSQPVREDSFGWSDARIKALVLVSGNETEYYDSKTDSWQPASLCQMNPRWRALKGSRWVWVRESVTLEEAKTGAQKRFRIKFDISLKKGGSILRADLFIRSDDFCRIFVNDVGLVQQYGGAEYPDPFIIDIGKFVKVGENIVIMEVNNFAKPTAVAPEDN